VSLRRQLTRTDRLASFDAIDAFFRRAVRDVRGHRDEEFVHR